jgi:hypothetical protein
VAATFALSCGVFTCAASSSPQVVPVRHPPRLVKLVISRVGSARFSVGDTPRAATDLLVRTDIGGLTGVLAAVFGKQPPDAHVWVMGGDEPVFVKSEAPMYPGGPILRTELASPQWLR